MHFKSKTLPLILVATLLGGCMDAANDLDDTDPDPETETPESPDDSESPDGSDDPDATLGASIAVTAPDGFYVIDSLSVEEGIQLVDEFQNTNRDYNKNSDLEGYFLSDTKNTISYDAADESTLLVAQAYHPGRSLTFVGIVGYPSSDSESVAINIPQDYSINAISNAIIDIALSNGDQFSPENNITDEFRSIARSSMFYEAGVSQLVLEGLTYDQARQSDGIGEALDRAFSEDSSNYDVYEHYLYHFLDGITFENESGTRTLEFNLENVTYTDSTNGETETGSYTIAQDTQRSFEFNFPDLGSSTSTLSSDSNGSHLDFMSEQYTADRTAN